MVMPTDDPAQAARGAEDIAAKEHAQGFIGKVIAGRYRIDDVLAMGGMGAVLRGEHVHMRKRVAIKVLHPGTQGLPELVTRFERESVVGAHAEHPNVAHASDFGRLEDGTYYLVLEYIQGVTLHELMKRGPVQPERAADIARQIARALDAIHRLDIWHRDLKPRNVMLVEGKSDVVKLIDFGFARVPLERFSESGFGESMRVTSKGAIFGTIGYIAPEAVDGMHAVNDRSDLYALGVILYEMLTGQHPFDEKDMLKLFQAHRSRKPPSFRERAPDRTIPRALEAITMRLLEKSPEARYESAAAVIEALDAALGAPGGAKGAGEGKGRAGGEKAGAARRAASRARAAAQAEASVPFSQAAARPGLARRLLTALIALLVAGGGAVALVPGLRERLQHAVESSLGLGARGPAPTSAPAPTAAPSSGASAGASAPSPSASAAAAPASGTASAAPSTIEGLDAATWRRVLLEASAASDAGRGAKAILALAELDPAAFQQAPVYAAAAGLAVAIELGDRAIADSVFGALAGERSGGGGPDVLFHVTSFYGGSQGEKRAAELLRRPEVAARATPALRVAMALRNASCKEKPALFDQAGRDGDERALSQLNDMRSPDCDRSAGVCCMPHEPRIDAAIAQIRARLQK